jgi:hypothetical protein
VLPDDVVEQTASYILTRGSRPEAVLITYDQYRQLMAVFILRGDLVIPDRQVTVCRDPEANLAIEEALAEAARWVVTGDEDLLSLGSYDTLSFMTPRDFLARLDETASGAGSEATDSADEV